MLNMYSEDSLTFSEALRDHKQVKNPSVVTSKPPRKVNRELSTQKGDYLSPRVKLIKRTELTLEQLLREFASNSSNQYVLKLDCKGQAKKTEMFDQWVDTLKNNHQKTRILVSSRAEGKEGYKAAIQQIIFKEISPTGNQVKHLNEGSFFSPDQLKFSFSKGGTTNASSNLHQSPLKSTQTQEETQEGVIEKDSSAQQQGLSELCERGEQNIDPNTEVVAEGIKGLQFAKNKRFKTTKCKRKAKYKLC